MVSQLLIHSRNMIQDTLLIGLPSLQSTAERRTRAQLMLRRVRWQVLEQHRHYPHLERKLYHLVNGLICFGLYAFVLTRAQSLLVLGSIGGLWFLVDTLRFRSPVVNRMALRVFGRLMRREELRSLTGNSYFILGLFIVACVFPRPIVCLSVLYLALGDPIAAIVGTRWGKHRVWNKKSVEGMTANFLVTALASWLCGAFLLASPNPWLLALVGGVCSVIAEAIPLGVDDNLSIPVVSATLLLAASHYLPLLFL